MGPGMRKRTSSTVPLQTARCQNTGVRGRANAGQCTSYARPVGVLARAMLGTVNPLVNLGDLYIAVSYSGLRGVESDSKAGIFVDNRELPIWPNSGCR